MKHFFTLLLLILLTPISHAQQISWDFSAGATTDGITKQNFPTMVVENGALKIVSNSGANPHIQFPIEGLDRDTYKYLHIRMKNETSHNSGLQLISKKANSSTDDYYNLIISSGDTEYVDYFIDMTKNQTNATSGVQDWSGVSPSGANLKFRPKDSVNNNGGAATANSQPVTFYIEKLAFLSSPPEFTSFPSFSTANHHMWHMSNGELSIENSQMKVTHNDGANKYTRFTLMGASVNATNSSLLIDLINNTDNDRLLVYYPDNSGNESSIAISLEPNSDAVQSVSAIFADFSGGSHIGFRVGLSSDSNKSVGGSMIVINNITFQTLSMQSVEQPMASIYPNPSSEKIFFTNVSRGSKVEIYDMNARRIKASILYSNSLDITDLDKGIYFVKTNNFSTKFVRN